MDHLRAPAAPRRSGPSSPPRGSPTPRATASSQTPRPISASGANPRVRPGCGFARSSPVVSWGGPDRPAAGVSIGRSAARLLLVRPPPRSCRRRLVLRPRPSAVLLVVAAPPSPCCSSSRVVVRARRVARVERRRGGLLLADHQREDRGEHQQRGERGHHQPADHGPAERGLHLAALLQRQRHRHHADGHGAGRHQDRPQAFAGRPGWPPRSPACPPSSARP